MVNVGVFLLNPTYLGLFKYFTTITQQSRENAVRRGFFKDQIICSCFLNFFRFSEPGKHLFDMAKFVVSFNFHDFLSYRDIY